MDQSCWACPGPFPMSFASSPKRTFESLAQTESLIRHPEALGAKRRASKGLRKAVLCSWTKASRVLGR